MRQNVRLGRVAGIPIGLQWSALAIIALIALTLATAVLPSAVPGRTAFVYWAAALPGAAAFLACLLAHELAHSLVAQRNGVPVRSITLWMLGGVSELEDEAPDPKTDLAIAAAGPLTSLALGAVFITAFPIAGALGAPPLLTQTLGWLGLINLMLAVFNLLPGAPLDGGRVLRAVLWRRYHDRTRADLAAAHAGRTLGLTLVFVGLGELLFLSAGAGLWLMLIGWFLTCAAKAEAASRLVHDALAGVRVGDIMTPQPDCAQAWHDVETFVQQTIASSRQDVFPVLGLDGRPTGVVTAGRLTRIPAQQRGNLLVSDISAPLPEQNVCAPDDLAADLSGRPAVAGRLLAVVVDGGRVVGMITSADFTRIVRRGLLLHPASTRSSA
ncbi:site-2 protease family protein [Actinomadura scrupuli]|uniref:site-2 protease family protein n=1 Tax=Actinomadura scrupuli TaxID=559629 RepID=UPI003D9A091B